MGAPEQTREVPMDHRLCRDRVEAAVADVLDTSAGGRDAGSLEAAEDKEFVLDDRGADRGPELILLEGATGSASLVKLPSVSVQFVVLKDFPKSAVNLISA